MKTYFETILGELLDHPYLHQFKYRKRGSFLIKKTSYGKELIQLDHWNSWNISLTVRPIYGVRFDILSKWFEKFSVRTLVDQRDDFSVMFEGDILGRPRMFEFKYYDTGLSYRKELASLCESLIECSKFVFNAYSSLDKMYEKEIVPILSESKTLPSTGVEWLFESLTLCMIVHPENYQKLKDILLKHVNEMMRYNEPNISLYYPRLSEILSYLENQNFDASKNR